MRQDIKAIETRYNGYRFRSRTEARWAVFFDALGVAYKYEPDGYELGQTANGMKFFCEHQMEIQRYLPDFYLPDYDMWVEVKGCLPQNHFGCMLEECKMWALISHTGSDRAAVVFGSPDHLTPVTLIRRSEDSAGAFHRANEDGILWVPPQQEIPVLADAIVAAKSARFEHGESGAK